MVVLSTYGDPMGRQEHGRVGEGGYRASVLNAAPRGAQHAERRTGKEDREGRGATVEQSKDRQIGRLPDRWIIIVIEQYVSKEEEDPISISGNACIILFIDIFTTNTDTATTTYLLRSRLAGRDGAKKEVEVLDLLSAKKDEKGQEEYSE